MDTIFALASGSTHAGVAVVRVSGKGALAGLEKLTGKKDFTPRVATLCDISSGGKLIDKGLALYFKSPASFTGEDVVEYHLHGGKSVIDALLTALSGMPSSRHAEPGEFTRRAFENGKLDLTEAEAVADLIAAETEAQRLQALDQLAGGLAKLYGGWADTLKKLLAHQEAEIEFPDEDLPQGLDASLKAPLENLLSEISAHLADNRRGEILRDGVHVAIVGAPNAGKSSLLNALARRDVAIVSDEAGTTRDIVEARLDLGGYPVILADTAGLRETENKIEAEGVKRARKRAEEADFKIALFDGTKPQDAETKKLVDDKTITAFSRADLMTTKEGLCVSAVTGEGMDAFLRVLTGKVAAVVGKSHGPALTRARHREALKEAETALKRGLSAALPELAAEDLRLALRSLGRITGRVHVEDLLDVIFRDFCIGK